jgi:glycosyltransferase involved in cell wall biosynthesis
VGIEGAQQGSTAAPVTVVLPTIGRPQLIEACLQSLESCVPMGDEILVVDSSDDHAVADVVTAHEWAGTED